MTKRQKRLDRIRQNPNSVSLNDLQRVLEDYGFTHEHTVGSHYTFSILIKGRTHLLVVPFRRPVKPIYVKKALRLIAAVIEARGDENDAEES